MFKISNKKAVIVCCNGSAALHALTSAIVLADSTNNYLKWATQSFTFPPSAQGSLSKAQIIDIDKDGGLCLDKLNPEEIDGIIVTNVFGNVVDIDKYVKWSNKYNKYLVFDNAATPFTFYKGTNSCNYGTGSVH